MSGIGMEMEIFIIAVVTGVIVRLFYEALCCLRKIVRHTRAAGDAEDFLFWVISALYVFVQIYQTNYGSIRWYFALGVVFGVAVSNMLLGKISKSAKKNLRN